MSNSADRSRESLLKYYQEKGFNPVPIDVEDQGTWKSHVAVRDNLYQNRLMLPLSVFSGKSVLEFGCCSGENALHLASLGAKLTLVEPNEQVLPRLEKIFEGFGFKDNIEGLFNKDVAGFESEKKYDIILAEGFLAALSNRDEMLSRICSFLASPGMAVVSFDDLYGSFLEITRQLILHRVCQLRGIEDMHSEACLEAAKELYEEDLAGLNAARKFEPWWQDNLLNPFVSWEHLWTYHSFIPILEEAGCEFYSSSPGWTTIDNFLWWKKIVSREERHEALLDQWYAFFPFFLTGLRMTGSEIEPASVEVVKAVSDFLKKISDYTSKRNTDIEPIIYPAELDEYLGKDKKTEFSAFNSEMKKLMDAIRSSDEKAIIDSYHNTQYLRKLWGTPCQYVCFSRGR
ncbi:class I SAM-dependent methyltransferase [Candidatus Omnitrophota bacterium]